MMPLIDRLTGLARALATYPDKVEVYQARVRGLACFEVRCAGGDFGKMLGADACVLNAVRWVMRHAARLNGETVQVELTPLGEKGPERLPDSNGRWSGEELKEFLNLFVGEVFGIAFLSDSAGIMTAMEAVTPEEILGEAREHLFPLVNAIGRNKSRRVGLSIVAKEY